MRLGAYVQDAAAFGRDVFPSKSTCCAWLLLSARTNGDIPQLLHERFLGLLPRALGFQPGKRLYLIEPSYLLIESHGNVVLERPGETSVRLLKTLADNAWWSKEALLSSVWGISAYRSDRHDSVLYMAIKRTRQALGPYRSWLANHQGAYRLQGPECHVLDLEWVDAQDSEANAAGSSSVTASSDATGAKTREPVDAVELIRRTGRATTSQLAKELQVAEMTALRELQRLVAAGVLKRVGRGRATHYELKE